MFFRISQGYTCLVHSKYIAMNITHRVRAPTSRAEAKRENLTGEVVLVQLATLAQVPRAHGVVQAARPQLRAVRADIDARRAVRVALGSGHTHEAGKNDKYMCYSSCPIDGSH